MTRHASAPDTINPAHPAVNTAELARRYRKICVLGLGYVGLPTAMMFARGKDFSRFEVTGVDISPSVLQAVKNDAIGELYPELAPWWDSVKTRENFAVSHKPVPSDVFLITVPTPVHPATKRCDLSAVKAATQSILSVLKKGDLVILESTVPPGTTRDVLQPAIETLGFKVGEDIHLCFSPERVLPGNTTQELIHNHRVLGSANPASAQLAKAILSEVIQGDIYLTNDITAEFCKLAENTYRDVNIALANELSMIADAHEGIEMAEALPLINMHPRVNLLKPGIGVGGHCIAVDPWFFVEMDPLITQLIGTSRRVNDMMPQYCATKIIKALAERNIPHPKVCVAGLTYKPDVADRRESPALHVVEILESRGVQVVRFDPLLTEYAGQTLEQAATGVDFLAVLVNHSALQAELEKNRQAIERQMRTPIIHIF